jgi:hypothetical protein
LNVIDPDFEDERMVNLRQALGVGYPTYVEMRMKYGLMDLKVDIKSFGVVTTHGIRGLELSRLITAHTESLKAALRKLPLSGE